MSHIRTALERGVLTVTLDRADKKNAITQAMYADLAEAVERAQTDAAVRVVLFLAEGDSFSAGNDIGDFAAIAMGGQRPTDMAVFRFLKGLAFLQKPAEDALLSTPFVNLALAPEAASTLLLPMVIGHQRAFELFALGEPISGNTAFAWGLANRVVTADRVDEEALSLARALASRAPGSIQGAKRLMRDGERLWSLMQQEGEVFGAQMLSPEAMEAFTAFAQKRTPNFAPPD